MSVRDSNGNRISVPNQVIQQAAGRIARELVDQTRRNVDRLVGEILDGTASSADLRREAEREMQEAWDAHTEPPDDGLEYEIVARTATSRKKKAAELKDNTPVYIWGLQSSIPRNGGHFITYEVQLLEDGSTSCNCPGWIFKKSSQDRGCKHTRAVEEEAKLFIKKHRAGESLPTVAPSEEQRMRLAKSKAGVSVDTGIKFNRVVDLED